MPEGGLRRLVRVYTCQNATLLEISCRSSYSNGVAFMFLFCNSAFFLGPVSPLVVCLAADKCLITDPGVASLSLHGPILLWRLIMK